MANGSWYMNQPSKQAKARSQRSEPRKLGLFNQSPTPARGLLMGPVGMSSSSLPRPGKGMRTSLWAFSAPSWIWIDVHLTCVKLCWRDELRQRTPRLHVSFRINRQWHHVKCCVLIGRLASQFRKYAASCHSGSDNEKEDDPSGPESGQEEEQEGDLDLVDDNDSLAEEERATSDGDFDPHEGDPFDTNTYEEDEEEEEEENIPVTPPAKTTNKTKAKVKSKGKKAKRLRSRSNSTMSSGERRKKKSKHSTKPSKLKLAPMQRGECLRN